MKQDGNAMRTAYRSHNQSSEMDNAARQIVQVLERETQFLDSRVVCRLDSFREAALRLHDQSVNMNVNASPAARVPGNRGR